jgi:hypothetical protein
MKNPTIGLCPNMLTYNSKKMSYEKKQLRPPSKKKKEGNNLSPRKRKVCHSISIAFLQSVAKIKTNSASGICV